MNLNHNWAQKSASNRSASLRPGRTHAMAKVGPRSSADHRASAADHPHTTEASAALRGVFQGCRLCNEAGNFLENGFSPDLGPAE